MGNTPLKAPADATEVQIDNSNIALVFIKPHAVTEKVKTFVSGELKKAGIEILAEGHITAKEIAAKSMIDTHYASIAKCAMKTHPSELKMSEEKEKEFQKIFKQPWKSAIDLGQVHNAKDACGKLGTMKGEELIPLSGAELQKLWVSASNTMKIGPGLYVANINEEEPLYVINGFYAAMRDKYVSPTSKGVYYYAVAFDPEVIPWSKFRNNIIGATDPTKAEPGSIRGKIMATWEMGLELVGAPNVTDNGVHASAGPLEGLKERTTWLDYPIAEDPFGKLLLSYTGADGEKLIKNWLTDAEVEEKENFKVKGKMFDLTEDKNSYYALQLCNNLALAPK